MAFVEPPMAWRHLIALSKAFSSIILDGVNSVPTFFIICLPASSASCFLRESTAGIAAFPGSAIPKASPMVPMVEAVPIVIQ
jgi:hypothetical protein